MKRPSTALGEEIHLERRNGVVVATYSNDEGPPERYQHGKTRLTRSDADGSYARVQRFADPMGRMKARGTISSAMARAGRQFRTHFDIARLHGIKAMDMEGVRVQNGFGYVSDGALDAREKVWNALEIVGGHASPAGQVVWAVLGEGHSIEGWADRQNGDPGTHKNKHTNRGILIASLGVLARHYGFC